MPPRALTPAEENAARMAFEMLLKKKLLKVNTGRGRKPGMGPVHAARTYTRTHAHAHTHADRQGDTTQCTHTFTSDVSFPTVRAHNTLVFLNTTRDLRVHVRVRPEEVSKYTRGAGGGRAHMWAPQAMQKRQFCDTDMF